MNRLSIVSLATTLLLTAFASRALAQTEYDFEEMAARQNQQDQSAQYPESHHGREGAYFSVSGGAMFVGESNSHALSRLGLSNEINFDPGYAVNGALGTYLGPIRVEAEVGHRATDIDSAKIAGMDVPSRFFRGDANATSLMGNIYVDFPLDERLDFYLGGGIGMARIEGDIEGSGTIRGITYRLEDDTDTVFAYQAMTGLAWKFSDSATLSGGYRLWSSDDPDFDLGGFDSPLTHTFELGLRFDF